MKTLVLLAFCSIIFLTKSFAIQLSPDAQISLLTCAPGDEIYSYFGHSAVRINDPKSGIDYVFNYGVFSFDAPNFVWRFMKGQTDYILIGQRMRVLSSAAEDGKYERSISNITSRWIPGISRGHWS